MICLFLIISLLLPSCFHSLEIVDFLKEEEKNGRLGSESQISIQKRFGLIWIIVVENETLKEGNTSKDTRLFLKNLREEYIKEKDHCLLMKFGLVNGIGLTMRIYCNQTRKGEEEEDKIHDNPSIVENPEGDDDDDKDDNTPDAKRINSTLYHTITRIKEVYGEKSLRYEKDVVVAKPNYWYGRSEHIQRIVEEKLSSSSSDGKKNKNKKKKGEFSHYNTLLIEKEWVDFVENNPPWGLDRIDQRFGSLDLAYHYTNNASSIDIYAIDTGVRTSHVNFGGRALFLTNTVGDNINTDCNGHGTHVLGIAGASYYGVAQGATLIGVKALDCSGNGDLFTIQTAIMAVIQSVQLREGTSSSPKTRRSVVNLSLGGPKSALLEQAVMMLSNNGIVTTVSAGNLGTDACSSSPAALGGLNNNNNILTVGASDRYDNRGDFSNYGLCVSCSAPGVGITSTWNSGDTATRTISGTSMAAPFVCGIAALLLQIDLQLTNVRVNQLILQWATPNIINRATPQGGGKNLVFSLIDPNQTVVVSPPSPPQSIPSPPLTSPNPYFNGGNGRIYERNSLGILALSMIVTIILIEMNE